jgi:LuxR family transcriptional regulator, maltose regulon positive regulatory protein
MDVRETGTAGRARATGGPPRAVSDDGGGAAALPVPRQFTPERRRPRPTDPRLAIPALPPKLISRSRLLASLDDVVADAAATLGTTGPGGGKSVLLSEWARRRPGPTPWLALSRVDNDPLRFWSLFVKAVGASGPVPLPLPTAWSIDVVPDLLDTMFAEQPRRADPVVVVLDDAHVLTDACVLGGLDRVVTRWSSRVRLVVAARSVPLLPLHRYRLAGQLAELRGGDLAMTGGEAAELLRAHGVTLSVEDVTRLTARTEGWTGGLRLAALRLMESSTPAEVALELALDHGSIGEYLVEEVLSVLSPDTRRVLVATSLLDEVTAEAAEALSGIPDCGRLLAALARTNSFVVPLDPSFRAFRYHQLLRDVLTHLARQRPLAEAADTSRRATEWFRATGDVANALRWALRSGDIELARAILVRGGLARAFVASLDLADVALDDRLQQSSGDTTVAQVAAFAQAALRSVHSRSGERPPARETPEVDDGDPDLVVTVGVAQVMVATAWGDSAAAAAAIERLLAEDARAAVAATAGLRGKLMLTLARGRFFAGRPAEVEPLLAQALDTAAADGAAGVQLEALGVQALANASAGRPGRAATALRAADELHSQHPALRLPTSLDIARARLAWLRADLEAMAEALDRAMAAGPIHADRRNAASIAYLRGLLLSVSGRLDEARQWLQAPVLAGDGLGLLGVYRDCELAAIDVLLGRPRQALALLERHAGGPFAVTVAVPMAFCLLAVGDDRGAARAVQPVLTTPSPQVDRTVLVTALLCQACIALARDDDPAALGYLAHAIELAGEDVRIPFARCGPAVAGLLARHSAMAERWPVELAPVAEVVGGAGQPGPRLVEPLTERELAVLRLLSSAMSTADIAAELVVSVNTVKTHLAGVYRKLGVGRRRDAVQVAREFELL